MKYKVRDKVRVRKDLELGEGYGGEVFVDTMEKFKGKVVEIVRVYNGFYKIKGNGYRWSDEMFEEIRTVNERIIISTDGYHVWAKTKDNIGEARCSPEDEFDIFVGAKLALERLEEKCKPYGWLKKKGTYFSPCLDNYDMCASFVYMDSNFDKRMKERGLVFATIEEAIEAQKRCWRCLTQNDELNKNVNSFN